jgi:hypothetical protein
MPPKKSQSRKRAEAPEDVDAESSRPTKRLATKTPVPQTPVPQAAVAAAVAQYRSPHRYRPGTAALREVRRYLPVDVWDFHDLAVFQSILDESVGMWTGASDVYTARDENDRKVDRVDLKKLFVTKEVAFYTLWSKAEGADDEDDDDANSVTLTVQRATAFMDRNHNSWEDVLPKDIDGVGAAEDLAGLFH